MIGFQGFRNYNTPTCAAFFSGSLPGVGLYIMAYKLDSILGLQKLLTLNYCGCLLYNRFV